MKTYSGGCCKKINKGKHMEKLYITHYYKGSLGKFACVEVQLWYRPWRF